jgi:hypothetical protein
MARKHPGHDLPGPAALRHAREQGKASFFLVERLLSVRVVQLHASGANAPRGAALVAYKVHLGIPVHAWFSATALAAVGLDVQGKKIREGGA